MRSWLAASESRFGGAVIVGGLGIGTYVVAALVQSPGSDLVRHVQVFALSFLFYLGVVWLVLSTWEERKGWGRRKLLGVALAWAVLLRLALLATVPSLSDDVFRYVWDGKVAAAGIDPYRYPPAAMELMPLRDSLWNGINAKTTVTPYPPLAEGLFSLVYRLAPNSLTAMQAMAVFFDLGVIVLLLLILTKLRMDAFRVLIYAWNPLVIVQFAHSGHFDAVMIVPLLGAIYLLAFGKRTGSGILLGISTLVKVVPAVFAPIFLPLWGVAGALAAATTVMFGFIAVASGGATAGLFSEATSARFNDSASYLLTHLFRIVTADPGAAARLTSDSILALVSLVLAAVFWKRRAGWEDLIRGVYYLTGLFLVLNAVVEPWYLTWMVPLLGFTLPSVSVKGDRNWPSVSWGWLLFSGSSILTDLSYAPGIGQSAWIWIRVVEYGPLYGLMAVWTWRRARTLLPPPFQKRPAARGLREFQAGEG